MGIGMTGHGGLHATISGKFAGTGRTVRADAVFAEVDAWSRLADPQASDICGRVRVALQACRILSGSPLTGFRGRCPPFARNVPASEEMGPPPGHVAPASRYNEAGKPALYLCATRAAVALELGASEDVWVQEFRIPVAELRIADLGSPESDLDQLLAAVMWIAELAGADGHPSQKFSRLIASMVAEHFDGMLVPGVRGNESTLYRNLVILCPGEAWRNWLLQDAPTPLQERGLPIPFVTPPPQGLPPDSGG